MAECFGSYYVLNGKLVEVEEFDNSLVFGGESVYEVLRMKEGVPYFFSDHITRLENSVALQGRDHLAGFTEIKEAVRQLSAAQHINEVNLKVVFNYNRGRENWLLYYIKPSYPSRDEYNNGVKAIFFHAERENPASKVINQTLRAEISQRLILEKAYEALLVNHENCITEGSRSNIFFIHDRTLFTAPDDTVLAGITRKYVIEICSEEGIELIMKCVNVNELHMYDAVVMTGTSPAVLPFSQAGDMRFSVNHKLITFLRDKYFKKAERSRINFIKG